MSSLVQEEVIFSIPRGDALGSRIAPVIPPTLTVNDLTVLNTFNGQPVNKIVYTDTAQTLTNKNISSATNIVEATSIRTVAISPVAPTAGQVLTATSPTTAAWSNISITDADFTGVLSVPHGGTGRSTLTPNTFLIGNGTSPILSTKIVPTGDIVDVSSPQTLSNKLLIDDLTRIVDITDNSIQMGVDAAGAPGTTAILRFTQTTNRIYTIPDSGANSDVIMAQGAQTIAGTKTHLAPLADSINEITPNNGVVIDLVRIRHDTIITPSLDLASISSASPSANVSLALIPKGTGAILSSTPDNTATGGNARGVNAVDLQIQRSTSAAVASGQTSFIAGGSNNTASAQSSITLGGESNEASGICSLASGRRARAQHDGAHIISDNTNADFTSTQDDEFGARFAGGYRFIGGTASYNDRLYVDTNDTLTTTATTPAPFHIITSDTDMWYFYTVRIVATTPAGDLATFTSNIKAKNVGNTLTLGTQYNITEDLDAALSTTNVTFSTSGLDIVVLVTGINGQVDWSGMVEIVSGQF